MKKEKKIILLYYLILLIILFSLFLGFKIIRQANHKTYIKNVMAKNNEEAVVEIIDNSSNTEEELDVNSIIATQLLNKINIFDNYNAGSYYGYFYSKDYIDSAMISDDVKIAIGITQNSNFTMDFKSKTYDALAPDGTSLRVIILSHDEIQNGINDFFGPNTSFNDTNLVDDGGEFCGFSTFKYDETRNVYMSNPFTCSGFPRPNIDSKVIKVLKKNKQIELYLKIAYINYESDSQGEAIKYVYKDAMYQELIESHSILTDNSYKIDKILNKLNTFKFTFTLNSNNYYYFTKVERI